MNDPANTIAAPYRLVRIADPALAKLLAIANARPPEDVRDEFYRMKEAILRERGRIVGTDLQEITKPCWGYRYVGCEADCDKCGGTGIYSQVWVVLERWQLADRIFHRPATRLFVKPEREPNIVGRIEHKPVDPGLAREACMTLALLFDRGLLRLMLENDGYAGTDEYDTDEHWDD